MEFDRIDAQDSIGSMLVKQSAAAEDVKAPRARFDVECRTPKDEHRDRFIELMRLRDVAQKRSKLPLLGKIYARQAGILFDEAMSLTDVKWKETAYNIVTTVGKNDLLDKYLSGSGYTAAWFCGLISSVGYSVLAAADTMASHAGWTEAGATNAPNYSASTRPTLVFAAASAGSKATSTASSFTFSSAGTIKGMFGVSNSTKDGTTGTLYNAVLFTGGDRVVASADVVNVSTTYTA